MSTLTSSQEQVLALISAGSTISCAAEAAGVHRNTIHNWFRSEPSFRLALAAAREAKADYWREQAEEHAAAAIDTILAIMTDQNVPAGPRLKAALSILDLATAPPLQPLPAMAGACLRDSAQSIRDRPAEPAQAAGPEPEIVHNSAQAVRRDASKLAFAVARRERIGRNDTCPCGSGRKFKRCCLDKAAAASSSATPPAAPPDSNAPPASFSN